MARTGEPSAKTVVAARWRSHGPEPGNRFFPSRQSGAAAARRWSDSANRHPRASSMRRSSGPCRCFACSVMATMGSRSFTGVEQTAVATVRALFARATWVLGRPLAMRRIRVIAASIRARAAVIVDCGPPSICESGLPLNSPMAQRLWAVADFHPMRLRLAGGGRATRRPFDARSRRRNTRTSVLSSSARARGRGAAPSRRKWSSRRTVR